MPDLSLAIVPLRDADLAAVERLDDRAFGPGRYAKTAYRLREGVAPDFALSCVARVGTLLVGANRITPIRVGVKPGLLLGPLTVDPPFRNRGVGRKLMQHSLDAARAGGHALVILVGDEPFYARVGFKRVPHGRLTMPGPVDPARLLYLELVDGAFEGVTGVVTRVG
jgi:predicted N-acetyltransferase YhbS